MKLTDYDFQLPERLIARFPQEKRDEARLLIVDRNKQDYFESTFKHLADFFQEGDCLVLNNTRVIPARLYGKSLTTNREHEVLLINAMTNNEWRVLIKKIKYCQEKDRLIFKNGVSAEISKKLSGGIAYLAFDQELTQGILDEIGEIALPPYILKFREQTKQDKESYQTVYSQEEGSVAAPTAGLHFTDSVFEQLKKKA